MKNKLKNVIIAGLMFGLLFGIVLTFLFDIKSSVIIGFVTGLLFGLALLLFMNSKAVKKQTEIVINEGEEIIYSGVANHLKNKEAVGGKLYLQKDKLQFQSHNYNIQNHNQKIDIKEIKEISFYNSIGIIPNGLAIIKRDGKTEKFVVNGRRIWKEQIEKLTVVS
nr:hypothetical protein [uncultured Carboxylicivirga sp.]